jgi:hypothetical protein
MPLRPSHVVRIISLLLSCFSTVQSLYAQGAKQGLPEVPVSDSDSDHVNERNAWFFRGRVIPGKPSAELRLRAYTTKMRVRAQRAAALAAARSGVEASVSSGSWTPLGPVPLASDASGSGVQDYHQVAGRATAVAIDPADPSGNTVYIGGAQGGVWKSTNAANSVATSVLWTAMTDDQATLSIGSIAIQPGNSDPTKSVILAGTGEANNAGDSYFGLGILRSADAGVTWNLISTANNGALSFSGLGGTRMAFSTAQTNTVVSAMATTSGGVIDGAVTANTSRGLYTSLDAGLTWTYNALVDPGSQATDATSATSVVYNASAGIFLAAVRYHGFYSSSDGSHWTRISNQPSGGLLSTTACPAQSTANNRACPIYRGEITVVPGRNEMYAWFIYFDSAGTTIDGGIWESLNGGASWSQINDSGITNCGDINGCGVQQGYYNLELIAVPNGSATDLYAGAINLYKCSIKSINPACSNTAFMNLTHVYGCNPIASLAHVHPDQHALAYVIPTLGTDSGNALMFLANDGGIYRSLDGFSGLNTGSCSGTNEFEDLNQNLGSMTQFVSFSQHPSDPKTLLGGTQDNGSPATQSATTSTSWVNVNGGDGGFNAIDAGSTSSWFVSNPDIPPGGLNIQQCPSGVNCRAGSFNVVVGSNSVGGDDGGFYFPYVLDPQSATELLVGTCRVWRGPRMGGSYTVLSPNFDTFGSGTCAGNEINLVRALATGGPTDSNGSKVIYATTDGLGPLNGPLTSPTGGHVWVTTNATGGSAAFYEVTQDINPNQFPVSSVAMDVSDLTGKTAFVTVMGFTGSTGHVWKTADAGATWTDFTGTALGSLPDAPANTVVVDASTVYVGTDVGVFESSTATASWTEMGPNPAGNQSGFLPNVAVTALALFNSGGQKLLRASTYGRGIWQFNLLFTQDFSIAVANSPQTVTVGQNATFDGTVTALNGYTDSITLSCTAGTTSPPTTCTPVPAVLNPANTSSFTVTAAGAIGDYNFNVQGVGADSNHITHQASVVLHVISNSPDFTLTEPNAFPTVNAGSGNASGPISVASLNGFAGTVSLSCSVSSGSGSCSVSPASVSSFPTTANVTVNATNLSAGSYQLSVQGTSGSLIHTLIVPFNVADFQLSGAQSLNVSAGGQGTANLTITPSTFYSGSVNATCDISALAGATCVSTPANPISVNGGSAVPIVATIKIPTNALPGAYNVNFRTQDASGFPSHTLTIVLTVPVVGANDFQLAIVQAFPSTADAGSQATARVSVTPNYSGTVNATCDASALSGQCSVTPANPSHISAGTAATLTLTLNIPNSAAPQASNSYNINLTVTDTSGEPSHSLALPLTVVQDFSLNSSTSSQSINAGQTTGPYQLTVLPNPVGSSFNNAVTLSCPSGLPSGATCSFTPNPLSPGSNDVVMAISTAAASRAREASGRAGLWLYALWLMLPGMALMCDRKPRLRRKHSPLLAGLGLVLLIALTLTSCGGGSNGGGGGGGGHQTTTYTVTVMGTSGTLSHSTTVTLLVTQ